MSRLISIIIKCVKKISMSVIRGLKRVVCGISGGVDSAVAAALLKEKGFDVVGAFMRNWDDQDEEGTCRQTLENDLQDARAVCDHLCIPFVEVSFVKEYWNEVFTRLVDDYEKGFTPNPDVLCNRFIKFGSFYQYAMERLGGDAIATGHYAQTSFGPFLESSKNDGRELAHLLRAVDPTKDQTLFLCDIHQGPLQRTMFPLGPLFKTSVRKLAMDMGMHKLAKKRDSVGICFIGSRDFSHFIAKYVDKRPGPFVDVDTGKVLGEHGGVHQWTIGQRCRLPGSPQAYYVCHRDPVTQTILAALGHDHPALFSSSLLVSDPHWISHVPHYSAYQWMGCLFKFQHTKFTVPCWVSLDKDSGLTKVSLSIPTRAVTPGQQAVFYRGNMCLGSGKIVATDIISSLECDLTLRNQCKLEKL